MISELFKSKGVRWISAGWTAFILENLVLSHNREDIISNFGADRYHLVYNTLSTAACGSIAWGYFKHGRKTGPVLAGRPKTVLLVGFALQTLGLIGVSQLIPKLQVPVYLTNEEAPPKASQVQNDPTPSPKSPGLFSVKVRCPMDFRSNDMPADAVYGMDRVSRHAAFWSLGAFSLGHAVSTIFVPEIVMFSFPIVFAYIGGTHQDYRHRRGSGGLLTPERDAVTSNVPFWALINGNQSWEELAKEMKWTNAGLAASISFLMFLRRLKR
jgi:hypothetical protein